MRYNILGSERTAGLSRRPLYNFNDSKRNKFKQADASLDAKTGATDSCMRNSGVVFSAKPGSAAAGKTPAAG
jgi:hypothetical protein